MKRIVSLLLCIATCVSADSLYKNALYRLYLHNTPWHHETFDVAMQKFSYLKQISYTEVILKINGYELYDFFKQLYDHNNLSVLEPGDILKIPKLIHEIWLGSPVPDAYKEFMQTWVDMHIGRGWTYCLWTDENAHEIALYNQQYYDATDNYGVKSDILRWEILYQRGGLYVDTDYECLLPFDIFHYTYDFYTGIQPLDTHFLQLGAALVGSRPGHPILKHCIETIKDDWHEKGAPKKTGPVHFTRSFYLMAGKYGTVDIALPPHYVYPLGAQEPLLRDHYTDWIQQGAFAVHWWSKSWMPSTYRPQAFRALGNDDSAKSWND